MRASLTRGGLAGVTRSLATEYASPGGIGDIVDGILYLEQATVVTNETLHIDGG